MRVNNDVTLGLITGHWSRQAWPQCDIISRLQCKACILPCLVALDRCMIIHILHKKDISIYFSPILRHHFKKCLHKCYIGPQMYPS